MEIVCYGCGRGQYVENTLKALETCHDLKPEWWIELDIQLTNDQEVVLFHDENMKQLCGIDGAISGFTLEKLQKVAIDQHAIMGKQLWPESDRKIPRLIDVLAQTKHKKLIIDISTHDYRIIPILNDILSPYREIKEFIIVSMFDSHISAAKKAMPWIKVGAGASEAKALVFSSKLYLGRFFKLHSDMLLIPVHLGKTKLLSQRLIDHVHDKGKKIFIWKQERPSATCFNQKAELLKFEKMGVDGIFTDQPEKLLMSLSKP